MEQSPVQGPFQRAIARLEGVLVHLARSMLTHPWTVMTVTAVLIALGAVGLSRLAFSMDYRVFFGTDDPHVTAFERLQKTYTHNDTILFVLAPRSGDVFRRDVLGAVSDLTAWGWRLPYAVRVDSLTNFQTSSAQGDDLTVHDLIEHPRSLSDAELGALRRSALKDELLINRLLSPDAHTTAVMVSVRMDSDQLQQHGRDVAIAARALSARLRASNPDIGIYMSGTLLVNDAFYDVARHDLLTLIPAMFLMLVAALAMMLRSLQGSIATFAMVGAANTFALGVGAWLGIRLTPPSAAAAPIVMTLAIAGCVHLYTGFARSLGAEATSPVEAMLRSLRLNFASMTLTTLTTFVGFATMNLTPAPPFHDLGNLVLIGITAAYLLSITAFPALVLILPGTSLPAVPLQPASTERLIRFLVEQRNPLLWSGIALTVLMSLAIPRNQLDDEFLKYFDRTVRFRTDNDFITEHLTGVYQIEYSIEGSGPEGITDPRYLRTVDRFEQWFERQPGVWHVDSITAVLKRVNQTLHKDDPAFHRLPQTRAEAAQFLLLYGMSLPVGLDLNDRINVGKSAARFTVTLHTLSANQLIALEQRASEWLAANAPPYMRAVGTGPAIVFAHIGSNSIQSGVLQELAAMGIISALMVLITRSVRIGALTMVPNVVPAAMAFGLWGVIDGRVNMALSTVVGMTLGIVVDDTIHLLHRYLHARRHLHARPVAAVHYALTEVGVAVAITSTVLIAGFLVLTLSPFVMNWGMGLLTAITLVFAMMVEFLMLPGLLLWADRDPRSEAVGLTPSTTA